MHLTKAFFAAGFAALLAGCGGAAEQPKLPPLPGFGCTGNSCASVDLGSAGNPNGNHSPDMAGLGGPFNGGATCDGCVTASQNSGAPCAPALAQCQASSGCQTIVSCTNGCSDSACSQACVQSAGAADVTLFNALDACFCEQACVTQCASECGAAPTSGMDGSVAPPRVDAGAPLACSGSASSSGTIDNTTPQVHVGVAVRDASSGGIDFALQPNQAPVAGDLVVELLVLPIMGQSSYANSPLGGCALLQASSTGWNVIDRTQLCDLEFSALQLASAPGTCDGLAAGSFTGVFTGDATLGGTFSIPLDIAWSQISAPSCVPTNSNCTTNAQCCTGSCSMYIGVCN